MRDRVRPARILGGPGVRLAYDHERAGLPGKDALETLPSPFTAVFAPLS
jgi:hypothetical protein